MLDALCTHRNLDAVQAKAASLAVGGDGWARFIVRDTQKALRADKLGPIMRDTHKGVGMVRLPALITEYAKLDGRPRSAIAWYARLAREAGKLPTTKRGRGAAHMAVREAVNLILACNGADDPKEGANAVDRLRPYEGLSYDMDELEDDEMREIGMQPTLGEALEVLILRTPYLFRIFDEGLSLTHPKLSVLERFKVIKRRDCVLLEKDGATLWLGSTEKNSLKVEYYGILRPISLLDTLKTPAKLRETNALLKFGIFMGLAKLFFEDSMQFPDELIPQSKDGGGDG